MKDRIINKKGFTLVELTLSLAFVSMLLLAVAMATIYLGNIYQKGVTVKTINQSGRDVMAMMRRDVAHAVDGRVDFEKQLESRDNSFYSFRMCLGNVSYVGNSAGLIIASLDGDVYESAIRDNNNVESVSSNSQNPDGNLISFVRVLDPNRAYCQKNESDQFLILDINEPSENYRELLVDQANGGDIARSTASIAIHEFDYSEYIPYTDGDAVHNLRVVFGTNDSNTIRDGRCLPNSEEEANFNACSLSEFSTLIQSGYAGR